MTMIHTHVIITAVVLLVGAFAALIICMCVDIVPIIKSRGSTLASRDSATQEQARKLKKSLRKTKHQLSGNGKYGRSEKLSTRNESASKNLYESNNHLPASLATDVQASAAVTKFQTCTPTTTSVVVSTATQNDAHCFATPEGDHSTQQTSSAASSLSQNSGKNNSVAVEVEPVRTSLPTKQKCSSAYVTVSVHNATKAGTTKTRSAESSPARSRALLGRQSERYDERKNRSCAQSSPSFNQSRQSISSIKLISQRSCDSYHESPLIGEHTGSEPYRLFKAKFTRAHTPNDDGSACDEQRRPLSALEESSDKEKNASRHRDYHDAPWDSSYREPLIRRDQSPCKWCYADHTQCTRHHHAVLPGSRSTSQTPVPRSRSSSPTVDHYEDNVPCSCGYHRPKIEMQSHTNSPKLKQRYNNYQSSKYDRQTSPSRSLSGGSSALHGSNFHRSSPCHSSSSSVSPSSLSSSSHSSKKKRRTKLEDIQEDAGWSDEETEPMVKQRAKEFDNESNVASQRNTPSTLHSSVVEGAASDNDQSSYTMDVTYQTNLTQYLGMKRGSRDLTIVNDTKTAIEGIVTYSGT